MKLHTTNPQGIYLTDMGRVSCYEQHNHYRVILEDGIVRPAQPHYREQCHLWPDDKSHVLWFVPEEGKDETSW